MKTGIVWFRNDLRVQDNTSLQKAVEENDRVLAVYIFDPKNFTDDPFGFRKTGKFRAQFLVETVSALKNQLQKYNISLFIYHQKPEDVFLMLLQNFNASTIYMQKEWTHEEVETVTRIKKSIARYHLHWIETYDQFLFHPEEIPFDIHNIPKVFTDFRKRTEKYSSVRPLVTITPLPIANKIENITKIPTIQELGFESFSIPKHTAFPFRGGEDQASIRLQRYVWTHKRVTTYKKTRNGLIGADYSSKFSPWLANGAISPRTIYHEVKKFEKEIQKNDSTYWLIFELIWRDFFKYISLKHNNQIFTQGGILQKQYEWKNDRDLVNSWMEGTTPEPFVNANMIELKKTGWMSNRGRQNVASYFCKNLLLDWRIGAAYFESLLMDYDVHSNYGNWMYVAGVGNDPRDRKFNVRLQAERYDPQGKFQNLWLQPTLF